MLQPRVAKALFNLERTSVLLADGDQMGQAIIVQILAGFGARDVIRCETAEDARKQLALQTCQLVIVDPANLGYEGYDLIPWIRRMLPEPKRHVPVLVATGHTEHVRVSQLRDAGANFVVSKPLSATILLDRILWMSREKRPYVETDSYIGPDRRWHDQPPPDGVGRRKRDRDVQARIAAGGEMSQEDIDLLMISPVEREQST
jgi:CheY-like chemotaxis protein